MNPITKTYVQLTTDERQQILDLILLGNEVDSSTLSRSLSQSALIGIYKDKDKVIATATIKKPLGSYKKGIFTKAKTNLSADNYFFELGYVIVDENHRNKKLGQTLCQELCKLFLSKNIFATTRTNNTYMQKILADNLFIEQGTPYCSRDNTTLLKLFTKQYQLTT